MFVIDKSGLRECHINDVHITDYREVAIIVPKDEKSEEKYYGKSIYLVPDNYIKDLNARLPLGQMISKSGRAGRRVRKQERKILEDMIANVDETEADEYLKAALGSGILQDDRFDDVKTVVKSCYKMMAQDIKNSTKLVFDDSVELVPVPITNFSPEKIEEVLKGRTTFWIKSSRDGEPKMMSIVGDHVENLVKNGYNGELVLGVDPKTYEEINQETSLYPIWHPYQPSGEEMVEITYIYGPNRSGKTYYAAKYATLWSELFKDWPIYLFSRREKDKVLDDLPNLSRVDIGRILEEPKLTMVDFEKSLVIFDDIDTIPDKDLCRAVQKLRDDIMETGRQRMIYVINTSHLGMNWGPTRTVLNEANSYTLFPRKGNYSHNFKILEVKMGINKDMIRKIIDKPDGLAWQGKWGWITVYKDSPQYVIWENGVMLL